MASVSNIGNAEAAADDRPNITTAVPRHPADFRNVRRPESSRRPQLSAAHVVDSSRSSNLVICSSDIGERGASQGREQPQHQARDRAVVESRPGLRIVTHYLTLAEQQQRAVDQQQQRTGPSSARRRASRERSRRPRRTAADRSRSARPGPTPPDPCVRFSSRSCVVRVEAPPRTAPIVARSAVIAQPPPATSPAMCVNSTPVRSTAWLA